MKTRRWLVCVLALIYTALALETSDAQVISAPDKGDELEGRAFVEAQSELEEEIRLREPNATINIDLYTYVHGRSCPLLNRCFSNGVS